MKRIILLICILTLTSACTNLKKIDYKVNINNVIKHNINNKNYNHIGNGYKYYLPKYMSVKNVLNYNEQITSMDYTYYLYLDIVSFYNNKSLKITDNKCSEDYKFNLKDKQGYLCINQENVEYYVEIIYNYAKIEVKVDKNDLNEAINNSIIILSTIKYDKDLIGNLIGDNKVNSKEESLNIFGNLGKNDNFIDIIEEYDYYEEESDIPDYDVIN